jgi:hypothetical protein
LWERSAAWHPIQKWTIEEAIEIMHETGLYRKWLVKGMIGLGWQIEKEVKK